MIARFVNGPLDGERRELPEGTPVGACYQIEYAPAAWRSHGSRKWRYELRADHHGPADLVGVLVEG